MKRKFLRAEVRRHSKLGKNRKRLQKWKRPRGRHNKMREKRFGYPISPTIGYRSPRESVGRIQGLTPLLVHNVRDLEKANKETIIIIAKVGAKNKMQIIKLASEKGIKIANLAKEKKHATK